MMRSAKIALKMISSLVAGIFLWNQVAWAGGFIDYTLEKQEKEQSRQFAPSYI